MLGDAMARDSMQFDGRDCRGRAIRPQRRDQAEYVTRADDS